MTRPIDIRDIVPRDAVLGDKRLGLDADENLAMTNQPDNSIIGTAASRNIGTAEDQIPLNSDLPASAKSGDYNDLDNLPTLGTAASKNTGTATGEVLLSEDLNMDNGETNFTSANYQPEVVNGIGVVRIMFNNSGGNIAAGASVSGSSLRATYFLGTTLTTLLTPPPGTWMQVTQLTVADGSSCDMVRTA